MSHQFSRKETNVSFSGLTVRDDLFISDVIQKAFIEVNEEGSEAAAASFGMMSNRMIIRMPPFICDKPFLFFIKDKLTGFFLFAGKIENPTKF